VIFLSAIMLGFVLELPPDNFHIISNLLFTKPLILSYIILAMTMRLSKAKINRLKYKILSRVAGFARDLQDGFWIG
jgi:hypothetical protein